MAKLLPGSRICELVRPIRGRLAIRQAQVLPLPMYQCLWFNVLGFLVQESDREDVGELKQELLALMLAMHERIQSLEVLQDQQNLAIQVCSAQEEWKWHPAI